MQDYLGGTIKLGEVLTTAAFLNKSQTEVVHQDQIGEVGSEIPSIVNSPIIPEDIPHPSNQEYPASPPICKLEAETTKKILTINNIIPQLNGIKMFLAVSDRVFKRELDFFLAPHTTKIIWGSHRVVFIFTHNSRNFTFYYDLELEEPISNNLTGGNAYPTTTIITKNRIFIPIPQQLEASFYLTEGTKKFLVRYDII